MIADPTTTIERNCTTRKIVQKSVNQGVGVCHATVSAQTQVSTREISSELEEVEDFFEGLKASRKKSNPPLHSSSSV